MLAVLLKERSIYLSHCIGVTSCITKTALLCIRALLCCDFFFSSLSSSWCDYSLVDERGT